ncbi:hypothetical protein ACOJBM_06545 [Rhizobium beringeri]
MPAKANVMEMVETVKLFEWAQSSLKRAPLRLLLNRVEGIDTRTTAFQDAVQMIRDNKLPALPTFVRAWKVYEQFSRGGLAGADWQDPAKNRTGHQGARKHRRRDHRYHQDHR